MLGKAGNRQMIVLAVVAVVAIVPVVMLTSFKPHANSPTAALVAPAGSVADQQGSDAYARTAVRNLVVQVESCHAATTTYAQCQTVAQLDQNGPAADKVAVIAAGPASYVIAAVSQSGVTWQLARDPSGTITRTCTPVGVSLCTSGAW
jgi:hypothetical protein